MIINLKIFNKPKSYFLFNVVVLFISAANSTAQSIETFTDKRDGKIYKTVTIGTQTWMAENLGFKTESGCWAYNDSIRNVKTYGYLYNFEAAIKACPAGWHLPSDEEWKTLENHEGMSDKETSISGYRGDSSNIGGKLKSIIGWKYPNEGARNIDGFCALPGGNYGSVEKTYYFIGMNAMFWTGTEHRNDFAWYRDIDYGAKTIFRGYRSKNLAFSVRCIRDY